MDNIRSILLTSITTCLFLLAWQNMTKEEISAYNFVTVQEHAKLVEQVIELNDTIESFRIESPDVRQAHDENSRYQQAKSESDVVTSYSPNDLTMSELTSDDAGDDDSIVNETEQEWLVVDQELQTQWILDQTINDEERDEAWYPQAEKTIAFMLESEEFNGSELLTVDCQTTLCRVDVKHNTVAAEINFVHRFAVLSGFENSDSYYSNEEHENGEVTMSFYVSRNGYRLPQS